MPRVGRMALLAIPEGQSQLRLTPSGPRPLQTPVPVFAFRGSKSKMATPVVSLPVPAVVGTERSKRKTNQRMSAVAPPPRPANAAHLRSGASALQ